MSAERIQGKENHAGEERVPLRYDPYNECGRRRFEYPEGSFPWDFGQSATTDLEKARRHCIHLLKCDSDLNTRLRSSGWQSLECQWEYGFEPAVARPQPGRAELRGHPSGPTGIILQVNWMLFPEAGKNHQRRNPETVFEATSFLEENVGKSLRFDITDILWDRGVFPLPEVTAKLVEVYGDSNRYRTKPAPYVLLDFQYGPEDRPDRERSHHIAVVNGSPEVNETLRHINQEWRFVHIWPKETKTRDK